MYMCLPQWHMVYSQQLTFIYVAPEYPPPNLPPRSHNVNTRQQSVNIINILAMHPLTTWCLLFLTRLAAAAR